MAPAKEKPPGANQAASKKNYETNTDDTIHPPAADGNPGELFLNLLAANLAADQRLILCGAVGDPERFGPAAWKPHPWRPGREIPFDQRANVYTSAASFGQAEDGSWRRRVPFFKAAHAIMVDDAGTKVAMSIIESGPTPSIVVETSPGNFQVWYLFEKPESELRRFDGLIRAFIDGKLAGHDPGMAGANRVGRVPGFTNGKKKHGGAFKVKLTSISDARYAVQQLLDAFGLEIIGQRMPDNPLRAGTAVERTTAFIAAYDFLHRHGVLKKETPDFGGWIEITCPWADGHTNSADTGAAIREPAVENGFTGAFRCHHGSCKERAWRDLTDWVNDTAAEKLSKANETPSPFETSMGAMNHGN